MGDCKHEFLVHCPVCDTVRCVDCGKVWTFAQGREIAPAVSPPYAPFPWPGVIGSTDGTIPPPTSGIIITCDDAVTGTVVHG